MCERLARAAQTSSIGAKGGQYQLRTIQKKTWPRETAAAQMQLRLGVVMATDFALAVLRGDMAKGEWADG